MDRRGVSLWIGCVLALGVVSGCGSLTPRNFRALNNPAPVVRAGAVGLGDEQPDAVAIPAWIARLDDPDDVVRLTANEALKRRTRQDFGFVPWGEADVRAAGVARWKAWWSSQANGGTPTGSQSGLVRRRRKG